MGKKFAFIGAGSLGFTRGLVRDILTYDAFQDCDIWLMDINEDRLRYSLDGVKRIIAAGNYPATVHATMDRVQAVRDADGVLITILQGDVSVWQHDILIPKKYGVDICVGDTRGPSGIFRFLRTAPVMLDICRDIEKYAPKAIVLNYTNPMAMLCRFLQEETNLSVTGLCHSVQGTAKMIAEMVGEKPEDLDYICAGINHEAFYMKLEVNGKDIYPRLRERMKDPEIFNMEQVRNTMFLNLGYYPTESSGHNSEYNAWFRKRPDLIEKYCTHSTNWNPGEYAYILNEYRNKEDTWEQQYVDWLKDLDKLNEEEKAKLLKRGTEYAASIFNAIFGDNTEFRFNGNVRNFGLVDNLPYGACVEVPTIANKDGLTSIPVGKLPPQIALLVNNTSMQEELAVQGCITGNREMIYHSILFDPLTSAVLSMDEIRQMVDEMFEQNKEFLTYFKD